MWARLPTRQAKNHELEGTDAGESGLLSLSKHHVRPLVELNDKINELTALERGINSTRIVVVGDQSHGKSSLLEALSGVKLPRGDGMKTRMPLVMQLRRLPNDQKEYATISAEGEDAKPERIKLQETSTAVERLTDRLAGHSCTKTISHKQIKLEVFRHDQDDLSLVDLPGITRVAADGGDGEALERDIKQLALRFIEPAESVILNVVSAMVDLATSAAVQMSLKVDPNGQRSLLCVTMVDKHKEGGLAAKIERACADMGISKYCVFAVSNKWREVEGKRSVRESEKEHLSPLVADGMAEESLGVSALTRRLVDIQCERIRETLPKALQDVRERRAELEAKAASLGEAYELMGESACRVAAMDFIDEAVQRLRDQLAGRLQRQKERDIGDSPQQAEGEAFEEVMHVEKIEALGNQDVWSKGTSIHGIGAKLQIKSKGDKSLSAYCYLTFPDSVSTVQLSFNIALERHGMPDVLHGGDHVFSESDSSWGWSPVATKLVPGPATLRLTGLFKSVRVHSTQQSLASHKLLCARLLDLDETLSEDLNRACSNQFLLSKQFRTKLEMKAESLKGCSGLPGTVSQEVPLHTIAELMARVPLTFSSYITAVHLTVLEAVKSAIAEAVPPSTVPRLANLLTCTATDHMASQLEIAQQALKMILRWEQTVHTSDPCYMSIVQSMRLMLFSESAASGDCQSGSTVDAKCFTGYMNLDMQSVTAMSNQQREIVDLQIKVFAYWTTVKKRLLDHVQLAGRAELAVEPIQVQLSRLLRKAVEVAAEHDSMSELLSPSKEVTRQRLEVKDRLQRLVKAEELLGKHFPLRKAET